MLKMTVYKKVHRSRNFFLLILMILLVLVSGKIILAHEKIATYQEAMSLFSSGKLVAAEEKFRAAKVNFSVIDYNEDISQKLAILSPIREMIEDIDKKALDYFAKNDLDKLLTMYERWQENRKEWLSGTSIQKEMYKEMVVLTKLDLDMKGYFSAIMKTYLAKLQNNKLSGNSDEEEIFTSLNKIPGEYFGRTTSAKTKKIQSSFQAYYAGKIRTMIAANAPVEDLVTEASRQFDMLEKFTMESNWLEKILDSHLLNVLTAGLDKKDYRAFAEQANSIKRLSTNMSDAKVFPFIDKSKTAILARAKSLIEGNQFAEAIGIYEALQPLENTEQLITAANLAWDKSEPIRVLHRLYTDKQFPNFVNATNKWGADSLVAAISKDGGIYFGTLKDDAAMMVTEGNLQGTPSIEKLVLQSNLGYSDNPVIYIEAKSTERKHHYLAYEVRASSIMKILDVVADQLTIEAKNTLVVDNPTGSGAGQQSYYELDDNGVYNFTKIKVDYINIDVGQITEYQGKKVRFTANPDSKVKNGVLVKLEEFYNENSGKWEKTYLLLKGRADFSINTNYTFIGMFNSYTNITTESGELLRVPVFQVETVE